jgi:hypothetical protein
MMRRRSFITLVGGAATAWPLAARAQRGERMRRVAFLHPYAENDPEVLARVVAFRQGLEARQCHDQMAPRIDECIRCRDQAAAGFAGVGAVGGTIARVGPTGD